MSKENLKQPNWVSKIFSPLQNSGTEALAYFSMLHAKHHRKVALWSLIQDKITKLWIINNQFVYNHKV
ncbi:hypothetical protein VK86_04755 [Moellerella wisconsensis]|nr:hypothetical protein VK86_04755 [Moellerella wisconsensis]